MTTNKAIIENNFQFLRIEIPSYKNWWLLGIGPIWIIGWFFGMHKVIENIIQMSEYSFFPFIWMVGVILFFVMVIRYLLWGYFGKETFEIERNTLSFEKTVFGIGIKKRIPVEEIQNVQFEEYDTSMFGANRKKIWKINVGKIEFEHGKKTYRFGLGTSDEEARSIVSQIKQRLAAG